jgi:hypothetical protein
LVTSAQLRAKGLGGGNIREWSGAHAIVDAAVAQVFFLKDQRTAAELIRMRRP